MADVTRLVKALTERFLGWPMPATVRSDLCVTMPHYKFPRHGTSLLNANEARQMVEYLLADKQFELLVRIEDECKLLKSWISDLQAGMYINCVYCGHRYGPAETTPVSMSSLLKSHIEVCSQHPMSTIKADLEEAIKALEPFAGCYQDWPDYVQAEEVVAKHKAK